MAEPLKRTNPLKRLFCVPISPMAPDAKCWSLDGNTLVIDLSLAPQLSQKGGALRLEDPSLPDRVLIAHGLDDTYYAYPNHCACGGFRIDPVPGESLIRCCTLMQSTYKYDGSNVSGPAEKPLTIYSVTRQGDALRIDLTVEQEPK